MKVLKFLKKLILGVIGFIFLTFAIIMTVYVLNYNKFGVAEISNHSFLIIKDDISSNKYHKGDLVIVENKKLSAIKHGDEIFTYKLDTDGSVNITVGIIDETFPEENAVSYENDGGYYSMEFVVGSASKVIPNLGKILSVILNRWGFLFIVVLPIFFIFVSQVYALIIEIKYGNPDEKDDKSKKKMKKDLPNTSSKKEEPIKVEEPTKLENNDEKNDKFVPLDDDNDYKLDSKDDDIDIDKINEDMEKILSDDD